MGGRILRRIADRGAAGNGKQGEGEPAFAEPAAWQARLRQAAFAKATASQGLREGRQRTEDAGCTTRRAEVRCIRGRHRGKARHEAGQVETGNLAGGSRGRISSDRCNR